LERLTPLIALPSLCYCLAGRCCLRGRGKKKRGGGYKKRQPLRSEPPSVQSLLLAPHRGGDEKKGGREPEEKEKKKKREGMALYPCNRLDLRGFSGARPAPGEKKKKLYRRKGKCTHWSRRGAHPGALGMRGVSKKKEREKKRGGLKKECITPGPHLVFLKRKKKISEEKREEDEIQVKRCLPSISPAPEAKRKGKKKKGFAKGGGGKEGRRVRSCRSPPHSVPPLSTLKMVEKERKEAPERKKKRHCCPLPSQQ